MPRSTDLQRARRRLALAGFSVEVLRRRKGSRRRRYTPFGFCDLLALAEGKPPLAVCVAEGEDSARRLAWILPSAPSARAWLAQGNQLQVWARVHDGRGGRYTWRTIGVICPSTATRAAPAA
jgi:hypothetical protein